MNAVADLKPSRLKRLAEFGLWAVLFGLAYAQSPLYTSNQNQYFLHGIARSGFGQLREDWLANTLDPAPLFSGMVQFVVSYTHPFLFYLIYLFLFGIYLHSLYRIVSGMYRLEDPGWKKMAFLAIMIFLHSAALRWILGRAIGGEWQYLFDGGVAGQRLLGTVLQPSAFGVFLLLSIQQYLEDHPYRAVLAAVLASWVHPTYLLSAATLIVTYMLLEWLEERQPVRGLLIGIAAGLLALPILLYVLLNFFPTAPDVAQLLAEFRIPEHTQPSNWVDYTTAFKLLLVLLALVLARRSQLFWIMFGSFGTALVLTLVQIASSSDSLALLFPWRLSTYLVPLSTAILTGRVLEEISHRYPTWLQRWSRPIIVICWFSIVVLVSAGMARFWIDLQRRQAPLEAGASTYVRRNLAAGETYLIPPKLQDFRLETGAPALVDFKSIPYANAEVRTWYERLRRSQFFYQGRGDCGILLGIARDYRLTHVLLGPRQIELECEGWERLYDDGNYAVYRLPIR